MSTALCALIAVLFRPPRHPGRVALPLELAPLYLAAVLLPADSWLHATHPRWWAYLFGIATAAAWTLASFGVKAGIPALAERIYAAMVTLAAGGWLAAATAAGPVTSPLPQALVIGGTVLAVPWWAHRRRRMAHPRSRR
ncbi:MAG: hypothetical protein ACLPKE_07990 [Streptosporangiaceae bacterium]